MVDPRECDQSINYHGQSYDDDYDRILRTAAILLRRRVS